MNCRNIKHLCKGLLGGLLLAACSQADEWETTGGDTGLLVTLTEQTTEADTRATPQELREALGETEFLKGFHLKVAHINNGKVPYDAAYREGLIAIPAGFYNLTATYGDNPILALDAPYYTGTTEYVEVKGHQQKQVSIACRVANALVSVRYENTEKLDALFSTYHVNVQVGEESVNIRDNRQSAYFRAGTVPTLRFCATPAAGGEEQSILLTANTLPNTFEAGDHLILTLRMSPEMTLEITKVEVKNVTVAETIPETWLPKPKLEAEGFTDNELSFAETEKRTAAIQLNTAMGLEELKLTFDFEDKQFASLNGREYLLSNADDKALVERTLGITLPAIGTKDARIDLSALVANMQTNAGETQTNTLTLDAKANGRWSSEDQEVNRTYTMVCRKPEFNITVQPENIWTKEFTIDEATVTAGDTETIRKGLKYQYKAEGSEEWMNSTERLIHLSETPSIKNYKVRALYRDVLFTNEIDIQFETPEQLPNSDMEEWNAETYKDDSYYTFNPWNIDSSPFWDTNNDFTTRNRHNSSNITIAHYNGFHAVSYVEGRNGLAAELRSTANGRGNTRIDLPSWLGGAQHSERDQNKVAGQLFTGTAQVDMTGNDADGNDTYKINKNATFQSRPTALQFYYKYAPYSNDTWSAHIELLDEKNNIIIQKDFQSSEKQDNWTQVALTLDYMPETSYAKCKYIYVIFCSTTNPGANMPYREITQTFYILENGILTEKTFETAYVGSVLTIDDISLIYDK